jgi:dihydrofolate reductase
MAALVDTLVKTKYSLVLAVNPSGVIGVDCLSNNQMQIIPWNIPDDLKNFRKITSAVSGENSAILMGRKTYDTVAPLFTKKVFPSHAPIVLSNNVKFDAIHPEVVFVDHLNHDMFAQYNTVHNIGGAGVVNSTFDVFKYDDIHITHVLHDCGLITDKLHPIRVDMTKLSEVLTKYHHSVPVNDDPLTCFKGQCTLCNEDIVSTYIHYRRI